jgi:hypothetical protein
MEVACMEATARIPAVRIEIAMITSNREKP